MQQIQNYLAKYRPMQEKTFRLGLLMKPNIEIYKNYKNLEFCAIPRLLWGKFFWRNYSKDHYGNLYKNGQEVQQATDMKMGLELFLEYLEHFDNREELILVSNTHLLKMLLILNHNSILRSHTTTSNLIPKYFWRT